MSELHLIPDLHLVYGIAKFSFQDAICVALGAVACAHVIYSGSLYLLGKVCDLFIRLVK